MSLVIVLHAPLPGHVPAGHDMPLLAALPYTKRLELERRDPAGRAAGLAGIALALDCIARLRSTPIRAGELRFPEGAKPHLPGGPFFSISHTAGRVACAASRAIDCGLDIEALPRPDGSQAAPALCLRRWTASEAVLKAAGLGLRHARQVEVAPDRRTAVLHGRTYHLLELSLVPGIVAHFASREPAAEFRIEAVPAMPVAPDP